MTESARRLLPLLGVLPDGIAHADLTALVPDAGQGAAAVLRQLGLAFDEAARLRMLAPIREHAAAMHLPAPPDLDRAVGHYARLAELAGNQVGTGQGAAAVRLLQAETGNITAMLERAAVSRRLDELASAVSGLAQYWRITGFTQPALARTVQEAVSEHGSPIQQARTWYALGKLARARTDLDEAKAQLDRALRLYLRMRDVQGRADCTRSLGQIALDRSDLNGARAAFKRALRLYLRARDVQGEADCIGGLAEVALRKNDLAGARAQYERALPLYRLAEDVLGEADCIQGLGDIALNRSDHEGARAQFERVLPLYQQVGDLQGEANCIQSIGSIARASGDLDEARARYARALPLFRQIGDRLGEANCIQGMGDIAQASGDLDEAQAQYERALLLYQDIPDPYTIGWVLVRMARIDYRGDRRADRWRAARQAWDSIGRDDLVELVGPEFELRIRRIPRCITWLWR